jgi:hypothetical protein
LQFPADRYGQKFSDEVVKLPGHFVCDKHFPGRNHFVAVVFQPKIIDYFREKKWKLDRSSIGVNFVEGIEFLRTAKICCNAGGALPVADISCAKPKKTFVGRLGIDTGDNPRKQGGWQPIVVQESLAHDRVALSRFNCYEAFPAKSRCGTTTRICARSLSNMPINQFSGHLQQTIWHV